MRIFIVNGTGGVGKTTFEKMVKEIAESRGKEIAILSTIDMVKNYAALMGWDKTNKAAADRRFLSDLKDALTRWRDLPYKNRSQKIEQYSDAEYDALFIDCREPEEIKRFVKDFNAITILVQRGEFIQLGNHADDNVMNYQYDITIDNSRGLDELLQEATIFTEVWIEEDDE